MKFVVNLMKFDARGVGSCATGSCIYAESQEIDFRIQGHSLLKTSGVDGLSPVARCEPSLWQIRSNLMSFCPGARPARFRKRGWCAMKLHAFQVEPPNTKPSSLSRLVIDARVRDPGERNRFGCQKIATSRVLQKRNFVELIRSDRKLKTSREGSK